MLTWNQTSISGRIFSKQHCRTCTAAECHSAAAEVRRKGTAEEGRATAMTSFRHILLIRFMTFISAISFKHFMTFISCITRITLISLIRIMVRCIKILALQIMCGRTKGLLLPKSLMTWAISFVLPCAQAGFPTSVTDNATPAAGRLVMQGTLVLQD